MKQHRVTYLAALVLRLLPFAGALCVAVLTVAVVPGVAIAQTVVVVHVRTADGSPGEARVTLTPEGGGAPHACTTSGGTCRMSIPPGTYVVTAEPTAGGRPPIPRPVPIPPTGEVTVSVTLR
jgi:hypothetical protein